MAISILFSLFFLSLSSLISSSSSSPQHTHLPKLVLKLINPNLIYPTQEPSSLNRLNYLQSKLTGTDIITHLFPLKSSPVFLTNISIGSPPVTQILVIDTGSDFLWLQSRPCSLCYTQTLTIYDPSKSYTYRKQTCKTSLHSMPKLIFNPKTRTCKYSLKYMDGSESKGTLAKETLTFNTVYEGSLASLPNVVFGCGHDNTGDSLSRSMTGILGLGPGKFSIIHRFGSKFSYCFNSLNDPSYPHNVLVLGNNGENVLGDVTPLEIDENGGYYVKLEAISINGVILPLDPSIFRHNRQTGSGGTILDTGSSLTHLIRKAYEVLKEEIEDVFDGKFKREYEFVPKDLEQCYSGDFENDLVKSGFPIVTFHFEGGAELSLDVESLFMSVREGVFCLAVVPSMDQQSYDVNYNIIGAMAQQSYNVGFDLETKIVSFERIDCGVLFDY